jgi:hypothetical protein
VNDTEMVETRVRLPVSLYARLRAAGVGPEWLAVVLTEALDRLDGLEQFKADAKEESLVAALRAACAGSKWNGSNGSDVRSIHWEGDSV